MNEKVNDETHFILLLLPYKHQKTSSHGLTTPMNKPSTDLYGTESNISSAFPIAPDVISDNNITISECVNRKSIFELTLTKEKVQKHTRFVL
jgi:hypothetical protein